MIKEITCLKAYEILKIKKKSYLIDVRTDFEWQNVGIPDLKGLNKEVFLIEWPKLIDKYFLNFFYKKLENNFNFNNHLLFICRSGSRSKLASDLAFSFGYVNCYNIVEGFEGGIEVQNNWKNFLPWKFN